ncbi:DUF4430 domain-containing protein [Sporolactobacillus kofuensis]|uniref:DUF4430 domain-containing protein n=1 Tax=Sporolactobacillus kofuensis TaxID=269672 RepID=A0ABW1WH93_9BACL|nr:DUF4430 domain-containing protein [Sporolactobacillus kofuensis]MCO7177058.1 DUF4430 domain-containing protein [Sporolactobacillus kofuensis]
MKHVKTLMLIVSIGLIVLGLAVIVNGIQEKQVTSIQIKPIEHVAQADKKSSESPKIKLEKSKPLENKIQKDRDSRSASMSDVRSSKRSNSEASSHSNAKKEEASAESTSEEQSSKNPSKKSSAPVGASNTSGSSHQERIHVEIKGYDNKNFSGNMSYKDGMTAFSALKAVADRKNIELDYSGSGSTSYVKSINGQRAGDKSAQSGWTYSVNGKTPNVSSGIYKLHSGDTLVWNYQE